jgi:hypothetical protein
MPLDPLKVQKSHKNLLSSLALALGPRAPAAGTIERIG